VAAEFLETVFVLVQVAGWQVVSEEQLPHFWGVGVEHDAVEILIHLGGVVLANHLQHVDRSAALCVALRAVDLLGLVFFFRWQVAARESMVAAWTSHLADLSPLIIRLDSEYIKLGLECVSLSVFRFNIFKICV